MPYREPSAEQAAFMDELVASGLLVPSGVPGIMGRGAVFEAVVTGFDAIVTRAGADEGAELLRFPAVLPRRHLEATGYLSSFPQLAAAVYAFDGTEREGRAMAETAAHGDGWGEHVHQTDLALTPAACYPIYPAMAARGELPADGVLVDVGPAPVFRREPAGDPARLQAFHMHELVRIGPAQAVRHWRDAWRRRARELLRELGLDAELDVASDPFFGRAGRLMAASQRDQELKFEVVVPITAPDVTAVASFNYHEDHFSEPHDLRVAGGERAHTACLGFGLERVALALLRTHGLEPAQWPSEVRDRLALP